MPSTYSPSLRIELIGAGEQAGTWNTTTNSNLGTLIESAIAGYTTVSVTSANQAFTALDGAADEARNAVIELTTTTGAAFAVYAPPQEKTYIIYNNTAYTASIYNSTVLGNTTPAGAALTIAAGNKTMVFTNGTVFSTLSLPSPGSGTVTSVAGTGTVNGITLTGTVTSSGNLTLGGSLSNVSLNSQVTNTLPIANGGTGSTSTAYCSLSSNVSGTLPVGNGGTGSSSLAGAGIPTLSATNSFTGINGFGITATAGYSAYAKPPTSSGAGFVGQNNGAGVPFAAATNQASGTLIVFYDGVLPSVTTNGYVQLSGAGVNYYSASDYRLKQNVTPLSNATAKLKQLAPKTYTWISHPEAGTVDGFIAHELQAVVPQAVSGEKDAVYEDGKPKYQAVDSSNLVPLLTAALQEALVRIEALEAKVGA